MTIELEKSPFKQAEKEIPKAWYEIDGRSGILVLIATSNAGYFANRELLHIDSITGMLLSIAVYIAATAADRYSTVKTLRVLQKAETVGIDPPYREENIFVGNIKNEADFNRRANMVDAAGIAISSLDFGLGLAAGGVKAIATANNLRKGRRVNRAIEIASSQSV